MLSGFQKDLQQGLIFRVLRLMKIEEEVGWFDEVDILARPENIGFPASPHLVVFDCKLMPGLRSVNYLR